VPKAPKDRRLRIPSKSIYNVKEQERKSTAGKKKHRLCTSESEVLKAAPEVVKY